MGSGARYQHAGLGLYSRVALSAIPTFTMAHLVFAAGLYQSRDGVPMVLGEQLMLSSNVFENSLLGILSVHVSPRRTNNVSVHAQVRRGSC